MVVIVVVIVVVVDVNGESVFIGRSGRSTFGMDTGTCRGSRRRSGGGGCGCCCCTGGIGRRMAGPSLGRMSRGFVSLGAACGLTMTCTTEVTCFAGATISTRSTVATGVAIASETGTGTDAACISIDVVAMVVTKVTKVTIFGMIPGGGFGWELQLGRIRIRIDCQKVFFGSHLFFLFDDAAAIRMAGATTITTTTAAAATSTSRMTETIGMYSVQTFLVIVATTAGYRRGTCRDSWNDMFGIYNGGIYIAVVVLVVRTGR